MAWFLRAASYFPASIRDGKDCKEWTGEAGSICQIMTVLEGSIEKTVRKWS